MSDEGSSFVCVIELAWWVLRPYAVTSVSGSTSRGTEAVLNPKGPGIEIVEVWESPAFPVDSFWPFGLTILPRSLNPET